MKTYESVKSWSLLSDLPVLCYIKPIDEYIVYWGGFMMSHQTALAVALEQYGIYHGPSVYSKVESDFSKIYAAGAFGKHSWDEDLVKNVLRYHRKNVIQLTEKYKVSEVFACFNPANAIVFNELNNESV
jgi:hypothetical protein